MNAAACRELRESCQVLRSSINENQDHLKVLGDEARADRAETRRLFSNALIQIENSQAESSMRLEQLHRQAAEDRRRADERHAAQMEVIQTLLLELAKTDCSLADLRSRLDLIEQTTS